MNMQKLKQMVGKNIKTFRLQRKITQEELAITCDVGQHYISEVENCKRNVTLNTLNTIANALEIDIKELFDDQNMR